MKALPKQEREQLGSRDSPLEFDLEICLDIIQLLVEAE